MPSFGGLISGVMGNVAKAGAKYAEQRLELDLKKELMDAEAEKQLRIDEIKRQRDIRDIPLKGAAETSVQVDRTTQVGAAETGVQVNRENAMRDPKAATTKATAIATGEGERANLAALGDDPKALAGLRKKTEATETLSSRLQGKLANLSIQEKEKVTALINEYDNPGTSPERKLQIKDALTVRGIIKPGEFDTEKVTTETTDDAGNTVKTERTQRRTSGAPTAKGTSGPKEGDTGTSKSGKPIVYRNGQWEYQ